MITLSNYLGLGDELESRSIFDPIIDEDSNFFINIKLLSGATTHEFSESYLKINKYFNEIGLLLLSSSKINDKCYQTALKRFCFSEVNGINLGFSESKYGSGFGKKLREQIIQDAYDIIKKGSVYPELFHLLSLFEENVGPDRLSDMIATIILDDIIQYTKRVNKEMKITPDNYPECAFHDGLLINPYKGCDVLLLPIEILHELPIAKCWEDIDRVVSENNAIRMEINELVCTEWSKMASGAKKAYLRETIFMNPEKCNRVVQAYRESTVTPYDINRNIEYIIRKAVSDLTIEVPAAETDSYDAALEILHIYKGWVENNKGFSVIRKASSRDREKIAQRTVHLCALYYASINGLDISPESNSGRGPVDFKISRGSDKTVIEIKLSSNNNCEHGFNIQIEEYAKAEQAQRKIFLLIDLGDNHQNVSAVYKANENRLKKGENPATIFLIDAREKESASKRAKGH